MVGVKEGAITAIGGSSVLLSAKKRGRRSRNPSTTWKLTKREKGKRPGHLWGGPGRLRGARDVAMMGGEKLMVTKGGGEPLLTPGVAWPGKK